MQAALAKLTVVIPVGPGDRVSPVLHSQLQTLPAQSEVRVVCADETAFEAMRGLDSSWDVRLAPPGRAAQQNAGAADARGEHLWFLHADSQLSEGALPALAAFIERGESALGYFDLRFLDDGPAWMPLNTFGAWVRSRWLGLPFGDQGFVLPRSVFEQLAGFDTRVRYGEDHDLVWRARKAGLPLRPLRAPLYTSARKYAEHGWWRTTRHHLVATWQQARHFSRAREAA